MRKEKDSNLTPDPLWRPWEYLHSEHCTFWDHYFPGNNLPREYFTLGILYRQGTLYSLNAVKILPWEHCSCWEHYSPGNILPWEYCTGCEHYTFYPGNNVAERGCLDATKQHYYLYIAV